MIETWRLSDGKKYNTWILLWAEKSAGPQSGLKIYVYIYIYTVHQCQEVNGMIWMFHDLIYLVFRHVRLDAIDVIAGKA